MDKEPSNHPLSGLTKRVNRLGRSSYVKALGKTARVLFFLAITSWLGYRLLDIGWVEVTSQLPTHPLFYLLFPLFYVIPAGADLLVYSKTWRFDVVQSIPVFVKKWILNSEVLEYSGEVYFLSRIRQLVRKPDVEIAETIRDYNFLSAAGSHTVSLVFIALFIGFGSTQVFSLTDDFYPAFDLFHLVAGSLVIAALAIPAVRFRKYLFATSLKMSLFVYAVHMGRFSLYLGLQILLWTLVMPDVPAVTWLSYTAVSVIISRIPISNKQLIFLGVGVEISSGLGLPEAAIFGLFGTIAALEKLFSIVLFVGLSLVERYSRIN